MANLNLNPALVNVFGPGTTGKSNFIKFLLSQPKYSRHVVFDPMKEYDPETFNVYRPDAVEYEQGNEELNQFLAQMLALPRHARPRYIVVDEAANFIPGGNRRVGGEVSKLMYHNTHYNPRVTLITANRHPTDLDSTLREMYDHMFVFGARGNAAKTLDDMASGFSDLLEDIPEYHFIHANPRGDLTVYEPVEDMGEYELMDS